MSKKLIILFVFFSLFSAILLYPKTVKAGDPCNLSLKTGDYNPNSLPSDYDNDIRLTADKNCFAPNSTYYMILYHPLKDKDGEPVEGNKRKYSWYKTDQEQQADSEKVINTTLNLKQQNWGNNNPGEWFIKVCDTDSVSDCDNKLLARGSFNVRGKPAEPPPSDLPIINIAESQCAYQKGEQVNIKVSPQNLQKGKEYGWWWEGRWCLFCSGERGVNDKFIYPGEGPIGFVIPPEETTNLNGLNKLCVDLVDKKRTNYLDNCLTIIFTPNKPTETRCSSETHGLIGSCEEVDCSKLGPNLVCQRGQCIATTTSAGLGCDSTNGYRLSPEEASEWTKAKDPRSEKLGTLTAVGCIPADFSTLVQQSVKVAIGVAGGVALLLIIAGAFQFITSTGNPDSLKAATGRITSALIGLLFVVFAVLLMQVIGGDILDIPGIPGFGNPK